MPFRELPGVEPCFFKKGDCIISSGETLRYVYYLKKGTVHREIVSANGVESIISIKEGGDVTSSLIGILILYMDENPISFYNFIAISDCYCLRIPIDVCKDYFHHHADLLEKLVVTAVKECSYITERYLGKSEIPAISMLCRTILERAEQRGDKLILPKAYNNIELSKLINIHKVTVSRMLCALKEEGVIEKTAEGMNILLPEAMQAYANNKKTLKYH